MVRRTNRSFRPPIESSDQRDIRLPAEPSERTLPAEPMERMLPALANERMLPAEPNDRMLPTEATDSMLRDESTLSSEWFERIDRTDSTLSRVSNHRRRRR